MIPKAAAPLATLVLFVSGCLGSDEPAERRGRADELRIYTSLPRHGLTADEGAAVEAGVRLALRRAGGRAGGFRVSLVRLDSTRPESELWDPGQVQANAERAAEDPRAIAYLGELGFGASAISLPVTNAAGLLQVSPVDGLTSLTRKPPGRAGRGAPERYYPSGRRSFVRLTPNDLVAADQLIARLEPIGAQRVALMVGEGVYAVELASQLAQRSRRAGRTLVTSELLRSDGADAEAVASELRDARPDAVLYAGVGDRAAAALLSALARSLPETPVLAAAGVLARSPRGYPEAPRQVEALSSLLPVDGYGRRARRLLAAVKRAAGPEAARAEALYGYEAARMTLAAISAGEGRRRAVIRAALGGGARRSVLGPYRVSRSGDVGRGGDLTPRPLVVYRLRDGHFVAER